jgi:hypothetical protein
MQEIDTQKLNEKLLKFCGFTLSREDHFDSGEVERYWQADDTIYCEPDLVHDFGLQRKFLYGKLGKFELGLNAESRVATAIFYLSSNSPCNDNPYWAAAPELDLCLAIALATEKYIDSMERK